MQQKKAESPESILGVPVNAGKQEIRKAYLERIQEHPPERSPEMFERIRDAYEVLSDPARRFQHMLQAADPHAPLTDLIGAQGFERRYVGPAKWLRVIEDTKK